MNDLVQSGFGSESTDQTFASASIKPVWHLTPLKIPAARASSAARPSLHSLCLGEISRNFHLYAPSHLSTLPLAVLARVLHRVRSDRGYETHYAASQRNPDATTLWAYAALLDPCGADTAPDHTLAIPTTPTLHYLRPDETLAQPEHPLTALPKLYERLSLGADCPLSFLTTLTLDGMDNSVNDTTVLNLRYCTHLSLLWTRGCRITDTAVRLLSSSLDLRRKTGLCRLRGWFLPGCRGVSDRSMRSLARWPGLTVVDVRETSVTTAGMGVLNRFSRSYFRGENADFQACTEGLRPVFSAKASPAEILEALCRTLLVPVSPRARGTHTRERWWIALHLVPTAQPLEPGWRPHPPSRTGSAQAPSQPTQSHGTYLPGIGMVYGQHAENISDSVSAYRTNLKVALRLQAEEEGLCDPLCPPDDWNDRNGWDRWEHWDDEDDEDDEDGGDDGNVAGHWNNWNGPDARNDPDDWKRDRVETRTAQRRISNRYKAPTDDTDRSKAFVMGTGAATQSRGRGRGTGKHAAPRPTGVRVDDEREAEVVGGKRELMLVRMVAPDWEKLEWTVGSKTREADTTGAPAVAVRVGGSARRSIAGGLVADILGTRRPAQRREAPKDPPRRPDMVAGSLSSSRPARPISRNSVGASSAFNALSSAPSQGGRGADSQASSSSPLRLSGSVASPYGFNSAPQKRRFEGSSTGQEAKRRGMKMFSMGTKPL